MASTVAPSHRARTRVDLSGVALFLIGLVSGILSYLLVSVSDVNPLVLVPSVVAATLGATSLTKREAPRG